MRRLVVVFVLLLAPKAGLGDVLFGPTYYAESRTAATREAILSAERRLGACASVLCWTGVGHLWCMGGARETWQGAELAAALRLYPASDRHDRLFTGVYVGIALMGPSRDTRGGGSLGASLGVKAGYKVVIADGGDVRLALEPYGSISLSPFSTGVGADEDRLAFWTAGVRCVLELLLGGGGE